MANPKLSARLVRESPRVVEIAFEGAWSHENGLTVRDTFDSLLDREKPLHLLLDLSRMELADSEFITGLVLLKDRLALNGGSLVLFAARPEVASTLRLLSLDRLIAMHPDQAAALKSLLDG